MSRLLLDTNILIDIATKDPVWGNWSKSQFQAALTGGAVLLNPIIYAEFAPTFQTRSQLDQWLDPAIFERRPLPYEAGWLASQAFLSYRRAGGLKHSPLPDFFIGAHAQTDGLTLVTRDPVRYRTYFPKVPLMVP